MMKIFFFILFMFFNIFLFNIKIMMVMMYLLLFILSIFIINIVNYNIYWMSLYNWLGLDNCSFILLLLTLWIIGLMFMVSLNNFNLLMFSLFLMILLMSLILSFSSMNYFMFYLFFEISLIPTFILIMGWGYQPERINASMFMLMYTMFASLPLLILMYYLYKIFYSMNYMFMLNNFIYSEYSFLFYFYMFFSFLVKLPMFMFHMWLPKAHVEAPVSGSMILAGIMLKLGGYGLIRSMMMMMNYCLKFNYLFISLSLFGFVILSLVCLRQFDLKLVVAYSSVVHMAMMLFGLFSMMIWGFLGGLFMMIGHGLCSSAMFVLVNINYERSKSRSMFINKGMINLLPTLSMWWFLFCACNMSSPVSLNLLSELMIINILFNWSMNIFIILGIGMFLCASYNLYLFSYCQHGKLMNLIVKIYSNNILEYMILLMHWIPLNLLILKIDLFF